MDINNKTLFEAYFSPYGHVNIDKINEIINCFKTSGYYDIIKTSQFPSNWQSCYQIHAERAGLNNGADYLVCQAIYYLNLTFNVNNGIHTTSKGSINLLPELKEDYRKLQITNTEIENYLNSKYWLRPHRDMTDIVNNIRIYIRNLGSSAINDVLINLDAIKRNYRTSDGLIGRIECVKMIKKLIECWMLLIVTIVPEVESDEEWLENTEKWLKEQKGGKLIKSRKKSNGKNKRKNKKYKKKTKTKRRL